jgi:predicted ATPase
VFGAKDGTTFKINLVDKNNNTIQWEGQFDSDKEMLFCIEEHIVINENTELQVSNKELKTKNKKHKLFINYEGSVLSNLELSKLDLLSKDFDLNNLRSFILSIRSLDLLSPHYLKKNSDPNKNKISLSGENLASLINYFDDNNKEKLKELLKENYPNLFKMGIHKYKSGQINIHIEELFREKKIVNRSLHLNDGMLRMMAIFAQTLTKYNFLLFDEIENGINPERIEMLMDHLVQTKQQVLVTTHSPMILNYIEDDIAREGVQLIYKTSAGYTQAIPFFKIPSMAKKLEVMGVGEVFIDTNLIAIHREIQGLEQG